ncbi:MAG: exosortase [Proteobacteria bacterium]|nr:exosortase [Pseudomonadota bacterium]
MRIAGSPRLWLLLALALVVTAVCWPSAEVLYDQWMDFVNITFTHGWLILGVCVLLVWRDRAAIAAAPARFWPLALVGLLLTLLAWMVCYRAGIQDLHLTLFPAVYGLAVAAAFGWPVARLMFFPVAFFVFALPSWAQAGNALQELTVLAMRGFLGLTGPHAVISGDTIHIPNGSFVIEEGCSGLHFMIVGLAIAALHGELRRDPLKTRVLQLLLMAGLALIANWVRVYTVIEAGYLSNMKNYLVSVSHYWFGWGVFAVALVAFFWLSTWLTPAAPEPGAAPARPATATPLRGFLIVVSLLLLVPGASVVLRRANPPAPLSSAAFLTLKAPWSALVPVGGSYWLPKFEGADDNEYLTVVSPEGETLEVFRTRFIDQAQGRELVGGSSSLLGRALRYRGEQPVATPLGIFRETEAEDPAGERSLLWYRYRIGNDTYVVPLASQLAYGVRALTGHPLSSLLAVRTECHGDCAQARRRLLGLMQNATLP